MRKYLFILSLFCLFSSITYSQKKYFQQQVDYTIDVSLDDVNHILRGFESIQYQNNSNDTLRFLFFHLWPNAYKNDKSALCEQMVEDGKLSLYTSEENDRGFIDSLKFHVDDYPVNVSNFNNYEDVALIELLSPLLPGKSIRIETSFRVVIPKTFSRLGHEGQDYQINQWYPKPAVYDQYGWHPMPYLEQGEFYSEFGNFRVNITVPSNYWIAATGELKTEAEKIAIEKRISTNDFSIGSATGKKTLQFEQNNIHDFAWFASKEFGIEKKICELSSGKKIDCYAFYKERNKALYKGSSEMISKTVQYYSKHIGEYPYSCVSVVDGKTQIGAGGMEYPMVTNIGNVSSKAELQTSIVHEVGHNWFYGALGNNERDYAWMDEGINSFYENKLDEELKKEKLGGMLEPKAVKKLTKVLNRVFIYQLEAKNRSEQPIELPSTHFTSNNYGAMLYVKAPLQFNYLEDYLGELVFEKCMQKYFETWKFKHPYPNDMRTVFEKESGKKLSWFFDDLMKRENSVDFKLKKVKGNHAMVSSTSSFNGPIPVSALKNNAVIETKWVEAPYNIPATLVCDSCTEYKIGLASEWSDLNAKNNFYNKNGLFRRFKFKPSLFGSAGVTEQHGVSIFPTLGYNYYDGFMIGAGMHNLRIPNQKFQLALAPMFATSSKQIVGTGFISYSIFPTQIWHRIDMGIRFKSYHDYSSSTNVSTPVFARYAKLAPFISFEWKPAYPRSKVRNQMHVQYYHISNREVNFVRSTVDSLYRPVLGNYTTQHIGQVMFKHQNNRTINPFNYTLEANGNDEFLRIQASGRFEVDYHYREKKMYVRVFAGKFFTFNNNNLFALQNRYLTSTARAPNDYLYNETYLARNEQDGFLSQQIAMNDGGLKVRTAFLANPLGRSDNWLGALNLRSDLPIKSKVKLQVFFDVAGFANASKLNPSTNKLLYDVGLELHLMRDFLVVYMPMLLSKDLKSYTESTYTKNRFLQTMSFALNLNKINWLRTQGVMDMLK